MKGAAAAIARRGRTISSSPVWWKRAGAPSTSIEETWRPARSRLNRAQALGRVRGDRGVAGQSLARGVVRQPEVVVLDVVAAVAEIGEVRVGGLGALRVLSPTLGGRGRDSGREGDRAHEHDGGHEGRLEAGHASFTSPAAGEFPGTLVRPGNRAHSTTPSARSRATSDAVVARARRGSRRCARPSSGGIERGALGVPP